jgi:hypothetical protein
MVEWVVLSPVTIYLSPLTDGITARGWLGMIGPTYHKRQLS